MAESRDNSYLHRLKDIHTFIFDMDGVLTDGNLIVLKDEEWYRRMNVKDGYALQLAVKNGFRIIIISGSNAPSVKIRLEKLGITEVYFKIREKKQFLIKYFGKNDILPENTLYMGDDIPDKDAMAYCGIATCPSDAVQEILNEAHYISPKKGGEGCVRDVIEMVLKIQHRWIQNTGITST